MTQTRVSLGQQALHVRVNLGRAADFDQVIAQLRAVRDITYFVEGLAAPPELLERLSQAERSRTELTNVVRRILRRLESQGYVEEGPPTKGHQPPSTGDEASLLAGEPDLTSSAALNQFGLQLRGLSFRNPLDMWIQELTTHRAEWFAYGSGALLLMRGLMWNIRFWQRSDQANELRDLEIRERRSRVETLEWEQLEGRGHGNVLGSSRLYLDSAADGAGDRRHGELLRLVSDSAEREARDAEDAAIARILRGIAEDPGGAFERAGREQTAAASRALTAVGEIEQSDLVSEED